jgi:membrane protein DedA with SNARE-associated domain
MSIVETLTTWVGSEDSLLGWLALAASAVIEYVFPPFPGDIVTVLAASLVIAASWSWWGVLSALMLGSMIGAALTFELGVRWARRRARHRSTGVVEDGSPDLRSDERRLPAVDARARARGAALDRLVARFHRHGPAYLVLNRFVPGVRSLFFVAAGLAGMSRRAVYGFGALSALLWNLALLGAGLALGANYDRLERIVTTYTTVAVAVMVGVLLLYAGVTWWRRRHRVD